MVRDRVDNPASIGVTRSLGYTENGYAVADREGKAGRQVRFTMPRADWEPTRRDDITVDGLDACLPLLGLLEGGAQPSSD